MHIIDESPDILKRLKTGTADAHGRIEKRVPIFDASFDLDGYRQLLESFYGYWSPLESRLMEIGELSDPGLSLPTRLKSHLLETDLKLFQIEPSAIPLCSQLPSMDTFPKALGCLYVMEGSTLGSKLISKHIKEKLQLDSGRGASYFNAYGPDVERRWAEFRTFLEKRPKPDAVDEIVSAARETFATFDAWLARRAGAARRDQVPLLRWDGGHPVGEF